MAGRKVWGLKQLYLQMSCKRRKFEAFFRRWASTSSQVHENCKASLLKKLNAKIPEESDNVCIYRVPTKLRQVEAKAYDPSIVSIGPYHHGDQHLKEMEEVKLKFFHRVFKSRQEGEDELDRVISAMEKLEPRARSCYADDVKLSRDEFIEMMTIDGCFILQLLREHLPEIQDQDRKRQAHMIRSVTALKEAGVVLEKSPNDRALDVQSEGRFLKIPPLHIDDHRGTLFRNMVAFEQCHKKCKPNATAYLFFFDGLVNSADNVEILHYKGIVHHSLGSNEETANLVNKLCREVDWDGEESYLHKVVCEDIGVYFMSAHAKLRGRLVHYYFNNWTVGISTVAGLFALYLTLIQTGCSVADALEYMQEESFCSYLSLSFFLPFSRPFMPLDQKDLNKE
ncbi:uncharacterized protein LOC104429867 [Eucalyptus grandis]|uniref:uncharacterized protein LOC104429867 n=1 Tax=Eucalyptus grandis TaxID=71139 RepID=UPI00192F0964|nr:uncharacterized protein LOC104429867 [Eucalyptus grandis]